MGLPEHQLAGGYIGRNVTTITSSVGTTYTLGTSEEFGRTFVVLGAYPTVSPSRVRLYANSGSRDLPTEVSRSFDNKAINDSVGLIADISFSAGTTREFSLDPVVYGATLDPSHHIYFTIETAGNAANEIRFTTFTLEDDIEPISTSDYAYSNRRTLILTTDSMVSGARYLGTSSFSTASVNNTEVVVPSPRAYLLLSASVDSNPASRPCRVRMYSIPHASVPSTEISRSFTELAPPSSGLIADFILDSGSVKLPFVPISFGANVETILTSQDVMESPTKDTIYFVVDNLHPASTQFNVNLGVYALED